MAKWVITLKGSLNLRVGYNIESGSLNLRVGYNIESGSLYLRVGIQSSTQQQLTNQLRVSLWNW